MAATAQDSVAGLLHDRMIETVFTRLEDCEILFQTHMGQISVYHVDSQQGQHKNSSHLDAHSVLPTYKSIGERASVRDTLVPFLKIVDPFSTDNHRAHRFGVAQQ